jgi:hypothetical protein
MCIEFYALGIQGNQRDRKKHQQDPGEKGYDIS